MPSPYNLDLTASQVNTALNAAFDSDRQPALGQTTLCNGNKIAAAIAASVGAESSTRADADTALDASISSLSMKSSIGVSRISEASTTSSNYEGISGFSSTFEIGDISATSTAISVDTAGFYRVEITADLKRNNFPSYYLGVFGVELLNTASANVYATESASVMKYLSAGSYQIEHKTSYGTGFAKNIYIGLTRIA